MIKATTYFENQIKGILQTLKHKPVCNNYIKLNESLDMHVYLSKLKS